MNFAYQLWVTSEILMANHIGRENTMQEVVFAVTVDIYTQRYERTAAIKQITGSCVRRTADVFKNFHNVLTLLVL